MKNLSRIVSIISLAGALLTSCKKDATESQSLTSNPSTPSAPADCAVTQGSKNGDIVAGRYIVAYQTGQQNRMASKASRTQTGADLLERNAISANKLDQVFAGEPGGFIASLSEEEAARLKTDPSVEIVEPDRVIALATCFTVAEPRLVTWNINRVGYGDGRGKTAWIIDTGIDMDHPDLTVDAGRSRSFLGSETSTDDANGHGTHVAGIIGAKNNSIGVLGVASGATLVSLRVLGADGQGLLSGIIQALAYVSEKGSAGDVVNMSLGEEVTSAALNQQVMQTASRGIYIAIAAGNDAQAANKFSPANTNGTNIYTVSAIDSLDRFASFSNFGNDVVDYAAPGVRILSTYSQGRYAYLSGTSMAAPHMAGLLLLKGRNINTSGYAQNDPDGTADPIAHY